MILWQQISHKCGKTVLAENEIRRDMAKKRYFCLKNQFSVMKPKNNACSNLCDTVMNHNTYDGDDITVKKYDYLVSLIFQSVFLTSRTKTTVKNSPKKIQMEQVVKHL